MFADDFYKLSEKHRNALLVLHGKAEKVCGASKGFAGNVVFLDQGKNVNPRYSVAKYPRMQDTLPAGESATRFLRELELQASAHYHPNVHWPYKVCMILGVPVAYFRRWNGDLSNYIEDTTFGNLGRLCLITQLVAGLLHCHKRGLAHQDLKPENVFIRDLQKQFRDLPQNDLWLRPMVADFGSVNLAKDKGEFRGTRPYMAPEQWNEKPIGEWTSVFVVGVILHELISLGEHPVGGHGGDWHRQQNPNFNRWQKNKHWRQWTTRGCPIANPLVEKDLAKIVSDCLSPDPNYRPTLVGLKNRLQDALAARSKSAADQLTLFLGAAQAQTSDYEWEYLKQQLSSLKLAIQAEYIE